MIRAEAEGERKLCVIFGGTSEGRELAETAAMFGWETHVYVATKTGADYLDEKVVSPHIGRLDADGMAAELKRQQPRIVMDATHPYAVEASENILEACRKNGYPYYRILRENSLGKGDHEVGNASEAAALLQTAYPDVPVLLTTGSKELPAFEEYIKENPQVYARILPGDENEVRALSAGIQRDHILEGCGPFSEEENLRVLKTYGIRCLVTKESGRRGGYTEKLRAAGAVGCKVIVLRRPQENEGITLVQAKHLLTDNEEVS